MKFRNRGKKDLQGLMFTCQGVRIPGERLRATGCGEVIAVAVNFKMRLGRLVDSLQKAGWGLAVGGEQGELQMMEVICDSCMKRMMDHLHRSGPVITSPING